MTTISIDDVTRTVRSIARTALTNKDYFCELDAAAGDADFGISLASGFSIIDESFNDIDQSSISAFLLKVSSIITANVGGCSGPVWGTGFMKAGIHSKDKDALSIQDLEDILSASIEGIMARGGAKPGDKTLIDSLIPIRDCLSEMKNSDQTGSQILFSLTATAERAAEEAKQWQAKKGRQCFTGERSIGSLDPGMEAIHVMLKDLHNEFSA